MIPAIHNVRHLLLKWRKKWRPDKVSFNLINYVPIVVKDYVIIATCIGEILLLLSRLLCNRLVLPPESTAWFSKQQNDCKKKSDLDFPEIMPTPGLARYDVGLLKRLFTCRMHFCLRLLQLRPSEFTVVDCLVEGLVRAAYRTFAGSVSNFGLMPLLPPPVTHVCISVINQRELNPVLLGASPSP